MSKIIIITGQVPSKSNGYRIGNNRLYKTAELKSYEINFSWQIKKHITEIIKNPFQIWIHVYFQSNRSDLDNAAKIILDCLQENKIILNDRLCSILLMEKHIDKINPRIEFKINEI